MAFDKNSQAVDTSAKSIVLMAIDVSRSDGSRYVPNPFVVKLQIPNAQDKAGRQNFKFGKDAGSFQKDGHTVYLVSMALVPGEYVLEDVMGSASAFPINSLFDVPLLIDFKVKPHSIVYVGHVTAKLRHRNDGEFRAGSLLPLIDQSITGMSTGTWDVSVDDDSTQEIALFRKIYPALLASTIEDTPLPPFDRAAVQRWWDGSEADAKKTSSVSASQPSEVR